MTKAVRFSAMKKLDPTAHWEVVRVNGAAIHYCMKEETRVAGPWEFGEKPIVKQNQHSVTEAREKRAKLNQEIHEKGPLQSLQEGLFNYKDYVHVRKAQALIELDK